MNPLNSALLRIGCAAGFSGDRTDAALPVVRDADRQRRPGRADLRDAGRAHAGAGAAGTPQRPRGRLRAAARRTAAPGAGACAWSTACASSATSARPTRAARRGASRALARELGLRAPRIAVVHGDDLSGAAQRAAAARRAGRRDATALKHRQRQRLPRRRSHCRCAARRRRDRGLRPRRRPVADGRARRWRISAGRATTGTGWPAPPWPGICSNAARRSAAATTPTPATRTCPDLARPGLPDRRDRRRRPLHHHQAGRHRRAHRRAHASRNSCCTRCTTRRPT